MKPTLVLYSGGQTRRNQLLHRELVRLARQKTDAPLRFTYIPFCSDGSETYFMRSVRRYARFGMEEFCCLSSDERPPRERIRAALRAHVVYLAGGNTFYFLRSLRRSGLLHFLREYAEGGGILAGLSAGAHILTPTIALAGVKGLDPDANEVGLRDLRALGLAPLEIMPHFHPSAGQSRALRDYSRRSPHPVLACPDGSGVVFEDGDARVLGRGVRFFSRGCDFPVR